MPTIERACPDCSKPATFSFWEKATDDKLFWSTSLTCSSCGCAIEMDDKGSLPEDLRSRLIEEEGLWELEISSKDPFTMKALHQVTHLRIKELDALKKQIPCVVYQGTETEVRVFSSGC